MATYDSVWYQWTGTATSTASTSTITQATWANWMTTPSATTMYRPLTPVPAPTSEQIAEHRRRTEQRAEELRVRTKKREEARRRAEALLLSCLNDEQTDEYKRMKRFRVRGSAGGVYEICQGNAYQLDEERRRPSHNICIHGSGVPEPDNMLAKKLMIETDEESFRRIGNFSRMY